MTFFPDFKTFAQIGGLTITWYGVIVVTAALTCYFLSVRKLKRMGYSTQMLEDFFITMLPIGFIGARLWYVIFEWQQYVGDPMRIFYIWEGGIAIQGGLIAATLYGIWFFRRKGINALRVADVVFPYLLIAQFIGRWGNFFNQEAYGNVVSEAFYNGWPSFIKDHMLINGQYRQPTFLFEGVGNLIGFILITVIYKKHGRKKRGDLAFAYITWYGIVRLFVEGLRADSLMLGPIRVAQLIALLMILVGIAGIAGVFDRLFKNSYLFRKNKPVILFDLDGTLLDTENLIFQSFIHTFNVHRPAITLDDATLRSFLGPTLHQTFERYSDSEEEIIKMIETYREFNHENHDELVKEMNNAVDTVRTLYEMGYDMGVVSNKNHKMVEHGINFFGMSTFFQTIVAVDDVTEPKPSPEGLLKACKEMLRGHDDLIYVGDFSSDVKAAKNMAAYSVAIVRDDAYLAEMESCKPMKIIRDLPQLIDLVKEDHEWCDTTIL